MLIVWMGIFYAELPWYLYLMMPESTSYGGATRVRHAQIQISENHPLFTADYIQRICVIPV